MHYLADKQALNDAHVSFHECLTLNCIITYALKCLIIVINYIKDL